MRSQERIPGLNPTEGSEAAGRVSVAKIGEIYHVWHPFRRYTFCSPVPADVSRQMRGFLEGVLLAVSKDKNTNDFDDIGPLPDEKQPEGLDNAPRSPFERPTFNRSERPAFGGGRGFGGDRGERPAFGGGSRGFGGERNERPAFGGRGFGAGRSERPAFGNDRGDRPSFGGRGGNGGHREGGRTMPIDADLLDVFPDPRAVNQALRALAGIIRGSRGGERPPRRDFGNDRPPRRDFGGDRGGFNSDRGPRDFGGDRPPFNRRRHRDDD